jgi:hypothetical protein
MERDHAEHGLDENGPTATVGKLGTPRLQPTDCTIHDVLQMSGRHLSKPKGETKVLERERSHLVANGRNWPRPLAPKNNGWV